eukprot:30895-Pelagococcus_subviridis.AAC.14
MESPQVTPSPVSTKTGGNSSSPPPGLARTRRHATARPNAVSRALVDTALARLPRRARTGARTARSLGSVPDLGELEPGAIVARKNKTSRVDRSRQPDRNESRSIDPRRIRSS